ncbi:hypothetical protein BD311DRAFT_752846 [Dichomitus squalens]|uniref:Uncharacterized protein n=1 Tax=Dichomitus squalens TaxID=114155 RepID=A0A4Q9MWW5_9APHY|nr:hypothetical protein BD311DRAFT_752846 [Dichomitus squalens]
MFGRLFPAVVAVSALYGSYASPVVTETTEINITIFLPGLTTSETVSASFLGSDGSGHQTWSMGFAIPTVTAVTATAPDTTITVAVRGDLHSPGALVNALVSACARGSAG